MIDERECCGTFKGTPHRKTCAKFKGYTQADIEAMRIETLEKAAKVCDEEAIRCEKATQECEPDEISALRSTAWKLSVCAAAIRSMK